MPAPLTVTQQQILDMIVRLRAEHHACTPGMIALALKTSRNWIVKHCDHLREQGLVEWSAGIGGSLRRTGTVELSADEYAALLRPAESVATPDPGESESVWTAPEPEAKAIVTRETLDAAVAVPEPVAAPEAIPPDAPPITLPDGRVVHVDLGKMAAALKALEAVEGKATKKERTPAQQAATAKMKAKRAESIRKVAAGVK